MAENDSEILGELVAHHKRWNINTNPSKAFGQFLHRLSETYESLDAWQRRTTEKEKTYGRGVEEFYDYLAGEPLAQEKYFSEILSESKNLHELVHRLQLIFFTLAQFPGFGGSSWEADRLYDDLKMALDFTPEIELEVVKIGNCVTLYPAGAKLLDDEVVNQTLSWLEPHPNVLQAFEKALTMYAEKQYFGHF